MTSASRRPAAAVASARLCAVVCLQFLLASSRFAAAASAGQLPLCPQCRNYKMSAAYYLKRTGVGGDGENTCDTEELTKYYCPHKFPASGQCDGNTGGLTCGDRGGWGNPKNCPLHEAIISIRHAACHSYKYLPRQDHGGQTYYVPSTVDREPTSGKAGDSCWDDCACISMECVGSRMTPTRYQDAFGTWHPKGGYKRTGTKGVCAALKCRIPTCTDIGDCQYGVDKEYQGKVCPEGTLPWGGGLSVRSQGLLIGQGIFPYRISPSDGPNMGRGLLNNPPSWGPCMAVGALVGLLGFALAFGLGFVYIYCKCLKTGYHDRRGFFLAAYPCDKLKADNATELKMIKCCRCQRCWTKCCTNPAGWARGGERQNKTSLALMIWLLLFVLTLAPFSMMIVFFWLVPCASDVTSLFGQSLACAPYTIFPKTKLDFVGSNPAGSLGNIGIVNAMSEAARPAAPAAIPRLVLRSAHSS